MEMPNPNAPRVGLQVAYVLKPSRDVIKAGEDQRSKEPLTIGVVRGRFRLA